MKDPSSGWREMVLDRKLEGCKHQNDGFRLCLGQQDVLE